MKLMDIEIEDGAIFKVQENLSFIQRNKVTSILEKFMDLQEIQKLQEKYKDIPQENLSGDMFLTALKKDVTATELNMELSIYLLQNVVHDPIITDEMLNDPDDPNSENYFVLGQELGRLAINSIGKSSIIKKTQNL